MDRFFDASWGRFMDEFWSIFGPKMKASWYQNGIKNQSYLKNAKKPKNIIKLKYI